MLYATAQPHRSDHRTRGVVALPAEDGPALDGRLERAMALLDAHGAELLEMVRVITVIGEDAQQIVAAVIWESAGRPETPHDGLPSRHTLASRVHSRIGAVADQPTALMRAAARLRRQQRAALALYLYGAHTTTQVASTLHLSVRDACSLLLEALDDLVAEPALT